METTPDLDREMNLLEHIEHDPDVTQASLATQLGVAVGTVNWHLKRLVEKGYVKVKRAQRRKLRYIITPEGIAFRARLTVNYIENSLKLYRRTRQRVRDLLAEVKGQGYKRVHIAGEGDIADRSGETGQQNSSLGGSRGCFFIGLGTGHPAHIHRQ